MPTGTETNLREIICTCVYIYVYIYIYVYACCCISGGFFTSLLPVYEVYITSDDTVVEHANSYDNEGDRLGLDSLVVCLLELVRGISAVQGVSGMLKRQLQPLVFVLLGYMQVSAPSMEAWELDPNQYVADEDDESLAFSVRNTGG